MDQKIQELLEVLIETIKSGKDVIIDNAPTVAKEIVNYNLFFHLTFAVVGVVGCILFSAIIFKLIKIAIRDDDFFPLVVLSAIACIISCIVLISNVVLFMKWYLMPTMSIIEYIKHI